MPSDSFFSNLDTEPNADVAVRWLQMRDYREYEVSSTGRFRWHCTQTEIHRDGLGNTTLFNTTTGTYESVCGWNMANRYFYNNQRTKQIAAASCLA